ncbi:MAG TPA: hypothetical protein VNX68_16620 [Nitrosopumilaceae archaeon]|jgi:hypothetical protein|nr:hypothetical protein [Nitrosopumilaceae archaeon]
MGTWNTKLKGNDTFLDIYQNFFVLYNQGENPVDVSNQILEDFKESFDDYDERNNSLFGLALAQWETKSLDPTIFKQVKEIIESGNDLEIWKGLNADDKTILKRKSVLEKFLTQISTEREKTKRRSKVNFEFSAIELIKIVAPDNQKVFEASEFYTNGVYYQTGSGISWSSGGGTVFYFIGQGKHISARWIDSQTLEVTHDSDIEFTKKDDSFYYCGDEGKVIYVPTCENFLNRLIRK